MNINKIFFNILSKLWFDAGWWLNIEKKIEGHYSVGNLTVYGSNAMAFGVTYWTKKYGYICFRLPLPCRGRFQPLYLYLSPNTTPWASTLYISTGRTYNGRQEKAKSKVRRVILGHGFDTESVTVNKQLDIINHELWVV